MDGIAIQSNLNTARNTQLYGRSKGANGLRKVLAEITNVQESNKAVTFDTSCNKPAKKSSQVNRNIIKTPGKRSSKPLLGGKPSGKNSSLRSLGKGSNPIKIYEDSQPVFKKPVTLPESDYAMPDFKEYMAPCTDGEFEMCLPDYVEKMLKMKPTFNIEYFPKGRDVPPSEEYVAKEIAEYMNSFPCSSKTGVLTDDDLLPLISNLTLDGPVDDYALLSDLHLLDQDEDLLHQIESEDSFSLEKLDEEIRSAGLDVPSW